jgi:hypothetical protein
MERGNNIEHNRHTNPATGTGFEGPRIRHLLDYERPFKQQHRQHHQLNQLTNGILTAAK